MIEAARREARTGAGARELLSTAAVFVRMALQYWFVVMPRVRRELRYWQLRAAQIADPALRALALETQRQKRDNVEGAAAFATIAPRRQRATVVRMLVAWQGAYDYVDRLAEQPCAQRPRNGQQLHLALVAALARRPAACDYYVFNPQREDCGYLSEMVDTARCAFRALPGAGSVELAARRFALQIVEYQTVNQDDQLGLARWARTLTPAGLDLRWWETAAAGSSSLTVLALLTAAADARTGAREVGAIERAYFPWVSGLHTLLDSLVDLQEDAAVGQVSLLAYYASAEEAASRLRGFAQRALSAARELPRGRQHLLILTAMASLYLTSPEAHAPAARRARRATAEAFGAVAKPSMLVLAVRRVAKRGPHRPRWEFRGAPLGANRFCAARAGADLRRRARRALDARGARHARTRRRARDVLRDR